MTTLIIARHGNTFEEGDAPRRAGARTDLPLVEKGRLQARAIGQYLQEHDLIPDVIYSSTLQRTKQTARLALESAGISLPVYALDIFNEIDYGPDENQPEDVVLSRIGAKALRDWEERAIVPQGWLAEPEEIIQNWQRFAHNITKTHDTVTDEVMDIKETVVVVTSNGIARFAPYITDNFENFAKNYPLKLKTGSIGILLFSKGKWVVLDWNIVPVLN